MDSVSLSVVAGSVTRVVMDSTTGVITGVLTGALVSVTIAVGDAGPVQPAARIIPSNKKTRERKIFFINTRYKDMAKYSLVDAGGFCSGSGKTPGIFSD
jgi:hypothetical protein